MRTPLVTLAIAGTDSGGAAGLAADLATFAALGTHGACVVTAVTAQDTTGVHDVHPVPVATIEAQLDAVLDDLPVAAVKTGMLGTQEAVLLVVERLVMPRPRHGATSASRPVLVVDPVLVATSGASLAREGVVEAYRDALLPVATVVTPNRDEAVALLGHDGEPADLARDLTELCPAVVLTGGPVVSTGSTTGAGTCTDWLAIRGSAPVPLTHAAVPTTNDHGTGCTFSAALAVELAHGLDLVAAVRRAADFTTSRLALSRRWDLGRGRGPVGHLIPTSTIRSTTTQIPTSSITRGES